MGSFYEGFAHITCYKIKYPISNKRPFIYSHSRIGRNGLSHMCKILQS
jgi:hypothetical protein